MGISRIVAGALAFAGLWTLFTVEAAKGLGAGDAGAAVASAVALTLLALTAAVIVVGRRTVT